MGYSADKSPLIGHLAGPIRRLKPLGAQRQEKCGPNHLTREGLHATTPVAPAEGPEKCGPRRPTRTGPSCNNAVASLDEGLEETLTLHHLGVFRELGTSLKTTNALEPIHARVESRIAKVDHWKNSEQKQRWLATALLDLEPRLRRIKNFRALPLLRVAFTRQIEGMKKSAA